jgi:hypothetical protein
MIGGTVTGQETMSAEDKDEERWIKRETSVGEERE